MPLSVKPECSLCEEKDSAMWRKLDEGLICCSCYEKKKVGDKIEIEQKVRDEEAQVKNEYIDQPKTLKLPLRKSTRTTRNYKTRGNPYALPKPVVGRGRGRRGLQKRVTMKTPMEGRAWMKTNRAYLVEGYLQVGDVVSLCGVDENIYYAQLRGFVCDLYGEKMGVVTWLLPKVDRVKGTFVPEDFYLGPDEDIPRRLEYMELEYRVPSGCYNFYKPPSQLTEAFIRENISVS